MTSENTRGRIFGAVEISEEDVGQDWRALECEGLLERAIVALDGAKMEAEEAGDENYARHVGAVLFPFLETELKKVREEADSRMTEGERALYDARAYEEAWGFALEILEPWMEITRLIGRDELTRVMKAAPDGVSTYGRPCRPPLDVRIRGEEHDGDEEGASGLRHWRFDGGPLPLAGDGRAAAHDPGRCGVVRFSRGD